MLSSKRARVTAVLLFILAVLTFIVPYHLPGLRSATLHLASSTLHLSPATFHSSSTTSHSPTAVASPPSTVKPSSSSSSSPSVDWSRFAYVQYVTNFNYLCNSVMLFEILHRLGTKADLLMMYPADYELNDRTQEGELLLKAKNMYGVKLTPIQVQSRQGSDDTWAKSYTKLLAFNQTQYDRVLSLDSDTTVLKLMDELFLLPSTPVALPRAFWLDPKEHKLTSLLVLVEPSEAEFKRVEKATEEAGPDDYDMEILNKVYGNSAMIIPHRKYGLLTRTFWEDHAIAYLGNDYEKWDPEKVIKEASLIHFSDWPVPKPWLSNKAKMEQVAPKCDGKQSQDCKAREIWFGLYEDFAKRRKEVCDLDVILVDEYGYPVDQGE